jgi:hypothetical protein
MHFPVTTFPARVWSDISTTASDDSDNNDGDGYCDEDFDDGDESYGYSDLGDDLDMQ